MKFLPYNNNHLSSTPQKFHNVFSTTTAVIKKTNKTSIQTLTAQIHFYSYNFNLKPDIL